MDEILGGANTAAIGTLASGYELVQFVKAVLIATNTYRLSGFLRGQAGSEAEMLAARPIGQNFILMNGAVVQPDLSMNEAGLNSTWRLGPAQFDHGDPAYLEFTFAGTLKPLRPLRPTQLKLAAAIGGFNISWIRRTRVDGDLWDLAEVPLGETAEFYKLNFYSGSTLKRSVSPITSNYFYSNADFATDFGASPTLITLRVSQVSAALGAGDYLEGNFNV